MHISMLIAASAEADVCCSPTLQTHRKNPNQRLHAVSTDLTTYEGTTHAFDEYAVLNKVQCPDYVFSCQGGAGGYLGYFPDLKPEQFTSSWQQNYQTTLWTAHVRIAHIFATIVKTCITDI